MRVLVTRTPDRGADLVRMLRERGARPVLVPVQEAEPVRGAEQRELLRLLDAAAAGPEGREPLWLVITSANTVRALALLAREQRQRPLSELLAGGLERGLRLAAVGPATAAELSEHGLPVHLRPHRVSSGAGLLDTWARTERCGPGEGPGTVLLPQSAAASARLAAGLSDLGWRVEQRVAYRMADWPADAPLVSAPPDAHDAVWTVSRAQRELSAGGLDAAVLTAPSAVRALCRSSGEQLRGLALAAIGQPTGQALAELGLEPVIAASTDPEGLSRALEDAVRRTARSRPASPASPAADPRPGGPAAAGAAEPPQEDLS